MLARVSLLIVAQRTGSCIFLYINLTFREGCITSQPSLQRLHSITSVLSAYVHPHHVYKSMSLITFYYKHTLVVKITHCIEVKRGLASLYMAPTQGVIIVSGPLFNQVVCAKQLSCLYKSLYYLQIMLYIVVL